MQRGHGDALSQHLAARELRIELQIAVFAGGEILVAAPGVFKGLQVVGVLSQIRTDSAAVCLIGVEFLVRPGVEFAFKRSGIARGREGRTVLSVREGAAVVSDDPGQFTEIGCEFHGSRGFCRRGQRAHDRQHACQHGNGEQQRAHGLPCFAVLHSLSLLLFRIVFCRQENDFLPTVLLHGIIVSRRGKFFKTFSQFF